MKITSPCIITSRLMAGVKIAGVEISIGYAARAGNGGRTRYQWRIDGPGFNEQGDDLQSGCLGGKLHEGLCSFLAFVGVDPGDEDGLFCQDVIEWARQNLDEIEMALFNLEETPNAIEE